MREKGASLAAFSNLSVVDREVLVSPPESFVADFQLCFRRRFLLFSGFFLLNQNLAAEFADL